MGGGKKDASASDLSLGDRKAVQTALEARASAGESPAVFVGWVSHFAHGQSSAPASGSLSPKEREGSVAKPGSEIKGLGSKVDKRLVVIGQRRMMILKGGKVELQIPLVRLQAVASTAKSPSVLEATFLSQGAKGQPVVERVAFECGSDEAADEVLSALVGAVQRVFPSLPAAGKPVVNVEPDGRVPDVDAPDAVLGGIADAYGACADAANSTARADIVWDLESVWATANVRMFAAPELEQPVSPADFRALMEALKYNAWFTGLRCDGMDIGMAKAGMANMVADCVRTNNKFTVLRMDDTQLKRDDGVAIADALAANKDLQLNTLSMARNPQIEDKGFTALGGTFIAKMSRGLVRLDVSDCNVKSTGTAALCKGLAANKHMSSTLISLNISGNVLGSDSAALTQFLSQPNQLTHLNIARCQAKLGQILGAMLRGCSNLTHLNISDNQLGSDAKSLAQFCKGSQSLCDIQLAGCGADDKAVKEILGNGIAANAMLAAVSVSIARNKLGVAGARAIAGLAEKMANVEALDVSENAFGDEGVTLLCEGLKFAPKLLKLDISRNFDGVLSSKMPQKKEQRAAMVDAIADLSDPAKCDCPLVHLVAAGDGTASSKSCTSLGPDAAELLYAMATNEQVTKLDVSGHMFGDKGAGAVGKMITTNDVLTQLDWDNNGTTLVGLEGFYVGLRKNVTLTTCPLPIHDISNAMRDAKNAARVADCISRIEAKLRFNQSPTAKFASGSGGGDDEDEAAGGSGGFAFLASAGREDVQKALFKLKSTGRPVPEDGKPALADAENQDSIMMELYGLKDALAQEAEHEMRQGLTKAAKAAYPVFAEMKAKLVTELCESAARQYKSLAGPEGAAEVKRLSTNLQYGFSAKDMDEGDFEQVLVAAAGAELANRANQALHSTVTVAADYLYEKLTLKLEEALGDIEADIREEAADGAGAGAGASAAAAAAAAGGKTKAGGKKEPGKTQSDVSGTASPKKGAAGGKTKPSKPSKSEGDDEMVDTKPVNLDKVETVEGNLEHATKTRAGPAPGRRPPTRRRRPAPPPQSSM